MTFLGSWNTYFVRTNTTTPYVNGLGADACGHFKVYYEYQTSNSRYKVNVECYLRRNPQQEDESGQISHILYPASGNIRSTVNGTNGTQVNYNKGYSYVSSQSLSLELITTQTFYVYPNSSTGQASVSFSGRLYCDIGGTTTTRTCSHTWSLPTVAVGSTITNNTSSSSKINFGSNVTFTITPPSGSSNTHTLTYNVGGTTYTIVSATSNTSISYAFPTSLINSFPNNGTPSITVTCTSSNGTTSSTEVYLQVPDTDTYRPTVSITLQDVMSNKPSALDGMWIKNKSLLKGTITATAKNGASISSYLSKISDFSTTYNTNPFTTQALTIAGSRTVTYRATDSRGLYKESTQNITVVDYTTPSISSAKVERCNSDGTLNESGTYGKVTVTYAVSPLNNGSENKNTKMLTVKKGSGTAQTITTTNYSGTVSQVFNFSLTETSTDTFTFTLTDIFGSVTYTFTIGTSFKTVSKRAGGKGIAFGKVATQDGFDCNMNAVFRGTIQLGTSSTGSTDRPIYLNAGSPAQCNTPASGNWFRGVPYVQSNGVMEAGRYIDFHPTNNSTLDYSKRIDAGTGTTQRTITLPDESGTMMLETVGRTTVGGTVWDYIKLSNGFAFVFGKKTINTKVNISWGNLYTSGDKALDNFPFTFTEKPKIQMTMDATTNASFVYASSSAGAPTSTTNPGSIGIARGSSNGNNADYYLNIFAFGKWK